LEVGERNNGERNKGRISVSDSRSPTCAKILADRGHLAQTAVGPNGRNNRMVRLSPLYTLSTSADDKA